MTDPVVNADAEARARIETTQKVLNGLVARIYDTQEKTGVYLMQLDDLDDHTTYFMNLQVQISAAYETWFHENTDAALPVMLAQIANDCFGLMRRMKYDAGKTFLDLVVGQAMAAAEQEMHIAPESPAPTTGVAP